jgi:hypothetical protein
MESSIYLSLAQPCLMMSAAQQCRDDLPLYATLPLIFRSHLAHGGHIDGLLALLALGDSLLGHDTA